MTVAQAAAKIGISVSTLYALASARRISHFRVGGKLIFSEEDVVKFLESCRVGAVTPVKSVPPHTRPVLKHLRVRV